ncbi:MAG: CoA-disulfide reductase [Erysipelothrix sp.]|nr:CoA-disulfide reductase [Erysipelothrix sp.]
MEVIVIGGIAAGMSVAAKARRENPDATITVIEKENYVSFGACGLPYYLGGQFEDENEMFARTPEQITASGINLLLNSEVTDVNFDEKNVTYKDLVTNDVTTKAYDRLMIATGASPIVPNIDGVDSDNVYTFTRLDDVNRLMSKLDQYQNIAIVGGGFIGVEVAEQLAPFNKNITLIHSRERLMNSVFDSEFGEKIEEALSNEGINILLESRANGFTLNDQSVSQVLVNDQAIDVDAVILAVGFKPNTHFLKDKLDMLDNGAIITDNFGRTSIKDVFAAGDCASVNDRLAGTIYLPLATYANKMGRIIGTNIVTEEKDWNEFNGALSSSYLKAGASEAGATGLNEAGAKALGLDYKTTLVHANNHSNYYPNQQTIMIKLIYDANTFVLYGAQIFGQEEAVLRIQALTTAIYAGLTTKELGFMDFGYAPPFASTWEALNIAANTAK